MRLVDAYCVDDPWILFELLQQRTPQQSISHKEMPTYKQHCDFFYSKPYAHWYLIKKDGEYIGGIYLTGIREIGISIIQKHQGNGYGKVAVKLLLELHPGRALWNVNPENERSIAMAKSLGGKLIQYTFEIPA